jgi:hypothetical protein
MTRLDERYTPAQVARKSLMMIELKKTAETEAGKDGSINWQETSASGYMVVGVGKGRGPEVGL